MSRYGLCILFAAVLWGCGPKEGTIFRNPSPDETGIDFQNTVKESDDLNILDYLYFYNGGGVAIGDINGDGLPDIFLSGNQVENRLYLNEGNLKFRDITDTAGIAGKSTWNTGAIMGDINGDGLLDIYVCAVVGINGFNGQNELFLNNGDTTFTESAAEFGLDFDTYSSSAALLDYDLDGDLDLYLLNHAVHTQESYGKAEVRQKRNIQSGDRLLRNDGDIFVDVSEDAGIYGGANGYGLGIAIADFNQDGYPDIYVGNDFHEDDYYYINNGNGTFSEQLRSHFGHTSKFSMGNDVADINHDGWPDLISLDMLPEDEKVLKSSEGDDLTQTQILRVARFGYHYQYSRNMLFVNQQNAPYSEIAIQSGIAATDWSWSALFGDYDQDGEQDIFISNGIPKRPNDLDFIKFASDEQIKNKLNNTKLVDQQAINMMPSGVTHNYVFKGRDDLKYQDMSGIWTVKDTLISGATAMADLDNDGDLDLITNTLNSPATLYVNKTDAKANYLKLRFNYTEKNKFGIGTKVFAYLNGQLQYKELYTVRGFQASSEPMVHFGFGKQEKIDSIKIVWPNRTFQVLREVATNQTLEISPDNTEPFNYNSLRPKPKRIFAKVKSNLGIDFTHVEDNYLDINRQKLIPYQISDRGPALAVGDLNGDGKRDLFFGGSKYIPSRIFLQGDTTYLEKRMDNIANDSIKEDITAIIADLNKDGMADLVIGTGGGDFYNEMAPLTDSYYLQNASGFERGELPEYFENAAVIRESDFDNDGDLDLFIGNNAITNDFGNIPNSFLLRNDQGKFNFVDNEVLQKAGMVTDAVWSDFDNDGILDLIVVGQWMSPRFFKNNKGQLMEVSPLDRPYNGLWECIIPFDIDKDGDMDYLLGNWGANTKFKASDKYPMKMFYSDFDQNGSTETIVAIEKKGKYYPLEGLDELSTQMVGLRKKFLTYKSFAGKPIEGIMDENSLKNSTVLEVNILESGFLENNGGKYSFVPFKSELQVAPIRAFLEYDFDKDGNTEILAAGNYFGIKPYHGRLDSFSGALIKDKNDVILGNSLGLELELKSVRHLNMIDLNGKTYLLVTFNNNMAQVYGLGE
ncbi:VCBS repeat-containing protein [Arenibacter troitsensis]|uniref:Repeat domain-containing protein n=1 Tax=Arenibacter troitsensis TaxID=188872 RepID=A0A1X7JRW1_9FLAO|nr:VCBS repeat-containing protein [Arenibacter troitsensis]SMG30473.1 Repeat domain-containing protein [Arenibacter troitsensis]